MSQQGFDFSKQISKRIFDLTLTDVHRDRQKLGTILVNKAVQKLKFSKNYKNKKHATKLIFFNEKKIQKVWIIFDIKN